jgi:hypothetical protein
MSNYDNYSTDTNGNYINQAHYAIGIHILDYPTVKQFKRFTSAN